MTRKRLFLILNITLLHACKKMTFTLQKIAIGLMRLKRYRQNAIKKDNLKKRRYIKTATMYLKEQGFCSLISPHHMGANLGASERMYMCKLLI